MPPPTPQDELLLPLLQPSVYVPVPAAGKDKQEEPERQTQPRESPGNSRFGIQERADHVTTCRGRKKGEISPCGARDASNSSASGVKKPNKQNPPVSYLTHAKYNHPLAAYRSTNLPSSPSSPSHPHHPILDSIEEETSDDDDEAIDLAFADVKARLRILLEDDLEPPSSTTFNLNPPPPQYSPTIIHAALYTPSLYSQASQPSPIFTSPLPQPHLPQTPSDRLAFWRNFFHETPSDTLARCRTPADKALHDKVHLELVEDATKGGLRRRAFWDNVRMELCAEEGEEGDEMRLVRRVGLLHL